MKLQSVLGLLAGSEAASSYGTSSYVDLEPEVVQCTSTTGQAHFSEMIFVLIADWSASKLMLTNWLN